ncbi:MAG: PhoU domain-containing protein [Gemmatimonadetes bacterium]|nr:PhoU domain-containing protein [Gemmatimonadota bacterium]
MWKEIVTLFRSQGPLQEAYDEAILMLRASHEMFDHAVQQLHSEGALETDIYKRDQQLNKYERSVRRKIVTHMSVSSKPDINLGLVLTAIVIDIERIGDYTKNIVELAGAVPDPFDGLELHGEVAEIEKSMARMFDDIVPALEGPDVARARGIIGSHTIIAAKVDEQVRALCASEVLSGRSGHAVTVALYMRYLKRVSAHLKNVATSVVNPYHRIGFREKGVKSAGSDTEGKGVKSKG